MTNEADVNIPLKRVKIGTFETDEVEVLNIVGSNLKFNIQVKQGTIFMTIKKDDIIKVALVLNQDKNYAGLVLRPSLAKEVEKCLQRGDKYCFHSKVPRESRFILEFSPNLDDVEKGLLQSFFIGVASTKISNDDDMEIVDEETPIMTDDDKECLNQKEFDCVNNEKIPTSKKKQRTRARVNYNPVNSASNEEEILEETASKSPSNFDRFEHFENTIHLLTYNDITIQMEDFKCLDRRELVSNFVLDFHLQYLFNEFFPEELRSRVHIFKTHFYTILSTKANYAGWKENKELKAADKRYERVKDIDSEVNIFDRDFLVFPCNTNEHYFLAIACYPRLSGAVYADTGEPIADENERNRDTKNPARGRALKASVLLIFDSISTNTSRIAATNHIKNFLLSKYKEKHSTEFPFELVNIRPNTPKCPQQTNNTDCGLFVMEFFERFFLTSPIADFRLPIDLSTWFDPSIILKKREAIANIIKHKMEQANSSQELPTLPDISFYAESDEMMIQEESEDTDGNQNNGYDQQNNENISENNNGKETFNNNLSFVDCNMQQNEENPVDNEDGNLSTVPEESGESTVTSTTDFVISPPRISLDPFEKGNGDINVEVIDLLDSD